MNEFTKDELIKLKNGLEYLPNSISMSSAYWNECQEIIRKIHSMIDNNSCSNAKWIAKAHLIEASSLISHAMCLLGLTDDN